MALGSVVSSLSLPPQPALLSLNLTQQTLLVVLDNATRDPPLDIIPVIPVILILIKQRLLQINFMILAMFPNRDDEEGNRDDQMGYQLVELDQVQDKLADDLIRGLDIDAVTLSTDEIAIEIDIEA